MRSLRIFFQTILLFTPSTHFPYYALGPELTVGAGIRARLTVFKAFLTIADLHLLTDDMGFALWVISTLHPVLSNIALYDFALCHAGNMTNSYPACFPRSASSFNPV